jgi:ring-1,2-phenylacetyl-CoA epoxidase subunit PaaD
MRMVIKHLSSEEQKLWDILEDVKDPEIPVLSLVDLGVVRKAQLLEDGSPHVVITPTYSGCPAMQVMEDDIRVRLQMAGFKGIRIETVLSPAWTTDWISTKGRKELQNYGIAPPEQATSDKNILLGHPKQVTCPLCKSRNTSMVSQFGSTPCKALYKCGECLEPFDYFKCI